MNFPLLYVYLYHSLWTEAHTHWLTSEDGAPTKTPETSSRCQVLHVDAYSTSMFCYLYGYYMIRAKCNHLKTIAKKDIERRKSAMGQ